MDKKTLILLFTLTLLIASIAPLSAQNNADDGTSAYYVRNMVISQVALGDFGYRVTYRNGRGRLHYAYIPHDWFRSAAGKAEQIDTWTKAAPFMQVYYRDGAFSHVRLFLIPTYDHVSWTVLNDEEDTEANFASEELVINYN